MNKLKTKLISSKLTTSGLTHRQSQPSDSFCVMYLVTETSN